MKRKLLLTLSIILFSILLVACKTTVEDKSDYVTVSFGISDFNEDSDSSINNGNRTIVPQSGRYLDYYELTGNITTAGRDDTVSKSYDSYDELQAATLELFKGTWDFTLTAYGTVDGQRKKLAVGTMTVVLDTYDAALNNETQLFFDLNFNYSELTTANLELSIMVPYRKLVKAEISLWSMDAGGNIVSSAVAPQTVTPTDNTETLVSKIKYNVAVANSGNYMVCVNFYTKNDHDNTVSVTSTRYYLSKLVVGQISYAEYDVGDLNNIYGIVYNTNVPDGETLGAYSFVNEFNSCTSVTLPTSSDLVLDHYELGGWYKTADFSDTAISTIPIYTRESVVLYAKWIPKQYKVNLFDYGAGETTGKTYSGSGSAFQVNYGEDFSDNTNVENPTVTVTGNEITFAGWYYDVNCTLPATLKIDSNNLSYLYDSNGDAKVDSIKLFAKWHYKYVYIDPVNGSSANYGYSTASAVQSFNTVKKLLNGNAMAEVVYLCDTYTIDSSDLATAINDISSYGSGIPVERHSNFTSGSMIVCDVNLTLSNLVLNNSSPSINSAITVNTGKTVELSSVIITDSSSNISIENSGSLSVDGNCYLGNIYLNINGTNGYLYPKSTLTKFGDSNTYVGKISVSSTYPTAAYDESISSTYITVIKGLSSTNNSHSLFAVGDSNYIIVKSSDGTEARICKKTIPGGALGPGNYYETISGALNTNTVYTKADSVLKFSASIGGNAITVSDIDISFWSEFTDITLTFGSYFETTAGSSTFKIKKGIPAGTDLTVKITYSYNGVSGYQDEFTLTVEEAKVIAAGSLGTYLANLKTQGYEETYVKISDSTPDYQALIAAISAPNTVKVSLDLSETSLTSIEGTMSQDCPSLVDIILPGTLTTIGQYAFSYCTGLTKVDIPDSVVELGDAAFYRDTALVSVVIPPNVTKIGGWAFYSCNSISSVVIPASVNTITGYAFFSCSSLSSVIFEKPNNWYCSTTEGTYPTDFSAAGLTVVSATDVAGSTTMASYLTNTYNNYNFYRNYAAD